MIRMLTTRKFLSQELSRKAKQELKQQVDGFAVGRSLDGDRLRAEERNGHQMTSEVISGVCVKLKEEFGDDVKLYTENSARKAGVLNSKTPLREPNFYVSCKSPSSQKRVKDRYFTNTQLLGNRYLRSFALCVECRWFPDWQSALDRLFACLEYIPTEGGVLRGTSMQGEYADEVLNFFVSYDMFVYYSDTAQGKEKMEKIELKEVRRIE